MIKLMTLKKIAQLAGCSPSTASVYICRSEFAHIETTRLHQRRIYKGVTSEDIERLKKLITPRKRIY